MNKKPKGKYTCKAISKRDEEMPFYGSWKLWVYEFCFKIRAVVHLKLQFRKKSAHSVDI
jgi:hypothetical protein